MKINSEILKTLKESKKVAIFFHIKPDGDCLGAASALKQALLILGKDVDIYSHSPIPKNYLFIKHINEVKYDNFTKDYDLHIAVDLSELKRMGKFATVFNRIKNTVCLDHHLTRDDFAKITHNENLSSASLVVYYYILQLVSLNADIACALYAGISSDTGCFMHSSTTSLEHKVSAELIDYGFDLNLANSMLFKYTPLSKFELYKKAYSNAQFFANGRIGMFILTMKDLQETGADVTDTAGMVNQITNVESCKIGAIIYEQERGLFKCSLRGKSEIDVSKVCEQFGGGGHLNAAGCNIFGTLNTVKDKLVKACVEQLSK